MIERGLRGSVRLSGLWKQGQGVDRVYILPLSPLTGSQRYVCSC